METNADQSQQIEMENLSPLLRNGNDHVGLNKLEAHLQSGDDLKPFLDSKSTIFGDDKRMIKIDFDFLLRLAPAGQDNDIEDNKNLKDIIEHRSWINTSFHPILSLYVDLKTIKYEGICKRIYWLFITLFMLPFLILYLIRQYFYIPGYTESLSYEIAYAIVRFFCVFSVLYMIVFELARFTFSYTSIDDYLKDKKNILEVVLIFIAGMTILQFWFGKADIYYPLIIILGALSLLSLLCKLYSSSFPLQTLVMQRIAISFFRYIMIGVVIVFLIKLLTHKKYTSKWLNYFTNTTSGNFIDDDDTFDPSFFNDTTADDDSGFEPLDSNEMEESFLDMMKDEAFIVFEAIFYCVFAFCCIVRELTTFVGPTNQDNKTRQNAHNYCKISNMIAEALGRFRNKSSSIFKSFLMEVYKFHFINPTQNYPNLHKIEVVYVNRTTREVTVGDNEKVLRTNNNDIDEGKCYYMNINDFRALTNQLET